MEAKLIPTVSAPLRHKHMYRPWHVWESARQEILGFCSRAKLRNFWRRNPLQVRWPHAGGQPKRHCRKWVKEQLHGRPALIVWGHKQVNTLPAFGIAAKSNTPHVRAPPLHSDDLMVGNGQAALERRVCWGAFCGAVFDALACFQGPSCMGFVGAEGGGGAQCPSRTTERERSCP